MSKMKTKGKGPGDPKKKAGPKPILPLKRKLRRQTLKEYRHTMTV
jgi:hypothetical protein